VILALVFLGALAVGFALMPWYVRHRRRPTNR
jgi:hypothetical protein